jgi:hypothetical protein
MPRTNAFLAFLVEPKKFFITLAPEVFMERRGDNGLHFEYRREVILLSLYYLFTVSL